MTDPSTTGTVGVVPAARYRCGACGNLTRFDVTIVRRTRSFHHYSVGGDLSVESVDVLDERVEDVSCRWCGHGRSVVPHLPDGPAGPSGDERPASESGGAGRAGSDAADDHTGRAGGAP